MSELHENIQRNLNNLEKYYEFEIQIVDHCNLNCQGCNHFANIANKWFMSEEEFQYSVLSLSKSLGDKIKRFMILGGEPLLHPKIKDFILFAREHFPQSVTIDVLTNGIILNEELPEWKDFISNNREKNICFSCTPYPLKYSNLEKDIPEGIGALSTRIFYTWPKLDINNEENPKNKYINCGAYRLPCFFIKHKKIYMCPFSGCLDIVNKKFNTNFVLNPGDYLELTDSLTEEDLKNFIKNGPEKVCSYCGLNKEDFGEYYWNLGINSLEDYLNISHKDLYLNDYPRYEKLCLGENLYKKLNSTDNFYREGKSLYDTIDLTYLSSSYLKKEYFRRKKSEKIDIIIPFFNPTKMQCNALYETLTAQDNLLDHFIYFISDCCPNKEIEEYIYDIFSQLPNCTFLKTPKNLGPGGARQLGIDNSYSDFIYFHDFDDSFYSKSNLNTMFKEIKNNYDFVSMQQISIENCNNECIKELYQKDDIQWVHGLMIRREFLLKNRIKFLNYKVNEDRVFMYQIYGISNQRSKCIQEIGYIYNKGSINSIGETTSIYELFLWEMLSDYELMKNSLDQFKNNSIINEMYSSYSRFLDLESYAFYFQEKRKIPDIVIKLHFNLNFIFYNLYGKNIINSFSKEELEEFFNNLNDIGKQTLNMIFNEDLKKDNFQEVINILKNNRVSSDVNDKIIGLIEKEIENYGE